MKRKTIRKYKDFITLPNDPSVANDYFVTKVKVAAKPDARYGLVAPKKIFKLAVQRNRVKRLLRDWIAANEDLMLPDFDYIFIARESILDCSRDTGRANMAQALKKISK